LVIVIDQGTKLLAQRTLAVHQFVPLLDSWLGFRRTNALPPTFSGGHLLATGILIIAPVVFFFIVWRGAWGQPDAVVAFAVFLGGVLSALIDTYYIRGGTNFLFIRLSTANRIETDFSFVAIVAGTIGLAVSVAMGRLPIDRIRPGHRGPNRHGG
jgi:lipoprotein signal peptidase